MSDKITEYGLSKDVRDKLNHMGSYVISPETIGAAKKDHTHPISEVVNLQQELNNKFDKSGGIVTGDVDVKGYVRAGESSVGAYLGLSKHAEHAIVGVGTLEEDLYGYVRISGDMDRFEYSNETGDYKIYHEGYKPTPVSIMAPSIAGPDFNSQGDGTWTTTEFINFLRSKGAFYKGYWSGRLVFNYASNKTIVDTRCGNINLSGCIVEVFCNTNSDTGGYTVRVTTATETTGAPLNGELHTQFTYVNNSEAYSPSWWRSYTTANKPTALEIGAQSLYLSKSLINEFKLLQAGPSNPVTMALLDATKPVVSTLEEGIAGGGDATANLIEFDTQSAIFSLSKLVQDLQDRVTKLEKLTKPQTLV